MIRSKKSVGSLLSMRVIRARWAESMNCTEKGFSDTRFACWAIVLMPKTSQPKHSFASFADLANAHALRQKIGADPAVSIESVSVNGSDFYRVILGPWIGREQAEAARQGAAAALVVHETDAAAYGWDVVTGRGRPGYSSLMLPALITAAHLADSACMS